VDNPIGDMRNALAAASRNATPSSSSCCRILARRCRVPALLQDLYCVQIIHDISRFYLRPWAAYVLTCRQQLLYKIDSAKLGTREAPRGEGLSTEQGSALPS